MKITQALLLVPALLLSPVLLAHTELQESTPADGAVLQEPPAALELKFSADVQLLKLEIANADGAAQDIAFTASASAAKAFSVPLPAMEPAAYSVNWTILGADGHRMEGSLSFLVDAVAHEPADAESGQDGD
jgi:methionine-rich copper-binding protein CopC